MSRSYSKIIKINKNKLINTFIELLKIKSPSKDEKKIVDYVSKRLAKTGIKVLIDNCGQKFGSNAGNIIGIMKSKNSKEFLPIFLGAHLDTVKLSGDVIPMSKNGRIINQNKDCVLGGDDKVAVAAIIEVMDVIKKNKIKTGDIYIILTISEEIGILGAKNIDLKPVKARYGFVFDADGDIGTIYNEGPYHNKIEIEVVGKASHAGVEPEKGINSIQLASHAISNLKLGRIDAETTCNIGLIEGGVETNIIPEKTKVKGEARSLKLSKLENVTSDIINTFKDSVYKNGARMKFKVKREYNGFKISEEEISVKIAKDIIKKMGSLFVVKRIATP